MRRLFIVLLSVCLMLTMLVPAVAASACEIVVGDIAAMAGETVNVPVLVKNNPGFACAIFTFDYDPKVLELKDISKGTLVDSANGFFYPNVDDAKVSWFGVDDVEGDGEVFCLTFKVLEREEYHDGSFISVSLTNGYASNFSNSAEEPISVSAFEKGEVACRVGDLLIDSYEKAADGKVLLNLKDAPVEAVQTVTAYYAADGKFINTVFGEANLDRGENVLTYTPNAKAAKVKIMLTDAALNPLSEALVIE